MTRTINRGRVTQVLMHHPNRGYKFLDKQTEVQHETSGWRLVTDDNEAEAFLKTQPQNGHAKPTEVLAQRGDVLDPKQAEIDRLRKELAAANARTLTVEVPLTTTTTADPAIHKSKEELEAMSKADLNEYAKERGIEKPSKLKTEEIISTLTNA